MLRVEVIDPKNWLQHCEVAAHRAVFGVDPPQGLKLDYALMFLEGERQISYATIRELDDGCAHITCWGIFHSFRGKGYLEQITDAGLGWLMERYKTITKSPENTNILCITRMLNAGFKIVGTHTVRGVTSVDMLIGGNK